MFHLLIRRPRVVDGSGNLAFSADIGLQGDAIVALGDLEPVQADVVIEA
jgi:N-acyl-D-aspartate/D-glutamate deacylase